MSQTAASSARVQIDPDSSALPGKSQGTAASVLASLTLTNHEALQDIIRTKALINELISIVGTPAYILVFVQFFREIERSRLWIRKEQAGHPHDLMTEIPLRKEPTYRSMDFSAVRNRMSPAFTGWCGAFTGMQRPQP